MTFSIPAYERSERRASSGRTKSFPSDKTFRVKTRHVTGQSPTEHVLSILATGLSISRPGKTRQATSRRMAGRCQVFAIDNTDHHSAQPANPNDRPRSCRGPTVARQGKRQAKPFLQSERASSGDKSIRTQPSHVEGPTVPGTIRATRQYDKPGHVSSRRAVCRDAEYFRRYQCRN